MPVMHHIRPPPILHLQLTLQPQALITPAPSNKHTLHAIVHCDPFLLSAVTTIPHPTAVAVNADSQMPSVRKQGI